MDLISKPLVGSSKRIISGCPNKALANSTFTFSLSVNALICIYSISVSNPRPCSSLPASVSASQPFISANSASSSAAKWPSSSLKSGFAYNSSFCFITSYKRWLPCIMVSKTVNSSYAKWSCFNTDILHLGSMETSPLVGSNSPDNTFKNVDLPAPLAPITP